MKNLLLIGVTTFLLTGCVNKHGVSLKYYSDCDEYYDLQGYYHKECGKDDVMTYKEMKNAAEDFEDTILGTPKPTPQPKGNVW
ncbi:MAG: hypothetical protein JXQ66_05530 [Campylobacterales bacterium]|nr:hypothetical protein [Campylobacterales bacterium]